VNLAERHNTLLVDEMDTLRNIINQVKRNHPFKIDAMVVLPDHLHALWTLPVDDKDFATRWMLIKSGFSRQIPKYERGIWQRRYWEHLIRDEHDYEKHVDYIHHNPVRHGYVKCATDWLYSSIHTYISKGILSHDWGYNDDGFDGDMFGEKV
jgi:putative transposase